MHLIPTQTTMFIVCLLMPHWCCHSL